MAELNPVKKLRYFSREINREGTVNILLVSISQPYLDKLSQSIYATREVQSEKRPYSLKVHTCKNIFDVLQFMPNRFYVDYIIFVLDSTNCACVEEVKNNLSLLDSSFSREKICLVNPDYSYLNSVVSVLDIWDFARAHQFNLVNGQTKDHDSTFTLTKRILNLVEACCGILNGIPMVNPV